MAKQLEHAVVNIMVSWQWVLEQNETSHDDNELSQRHIGQ
jgi:hypothetical protein